MSVEGRQVILLLLCTIALTATGIVGGLYVAHWIGASSIDGLVFGIIVSYTMSLLVDRYAIT